MNQVIKNISLTEDCSLFRKNIVNITFEDCQFDHLILSDFILENVRFVTCKFDHVFVESFFAKNVLFSRCEMFSLSLRGSRKITRKKLFSQIKHKRLEGVRFENTNIVEMVLGGNLEVIDCEFPKGDNYLSVRNPFLVYSKCIEHVDKNWEGERRRIGLIELQDYVSKEIEKQNVDFISFSYNEHLAKDVNDTLRAVFLLVRDVSISIESV